MFERPIVDVLLDDLTLMRLQRDAEAIQRRAAESKLAAAEATIRELSRGRR